MIKKVLIVNRGEITKRIKKTLDKLGLDSVGLYSPKERNASWLRGLEAFSLEKETYLSIPKILEIMKESKATAVHPGYGFLSENADFAKVLIKNGILFIGPNPKAMFMMGDKIESKKVATAAGLLVIPGFDGQVSTVEEALLHAKNIGYPVLIKASAGGGGKGIKIVCNDEEMAMAFDRGSAEALNAFGDARLLIEKYIEDSRHVEIQILGDKHGNCIYLPERECSIQRRNQKVIEESPSSIVDDDMRKLLGEQAVKLAKAVGYDSAGTCEFLVDKKTGKFYFLEMNTRIQVEHPITELVTGLDIVDLMINSAQGNPLPLKQEDIALKGWALETRICAEDPSSYLPFAGVLKSYIEPSLNSPLGMVRCDSGVEQGSEISVFYDSLICKVSTHSTTRQGAIELMKNALDSFVIDGITFITPGVVNNIPLLRDILENDSFTQGDMDTGFLKKAYPDGFNGRKLTDSAMKELLAIAAAIYFKRGRRNGDIFDKELFISINNGEFHNIKIEEINGGQYLIDGKYKTTLNDWKMENPLINATIDGVERILQFSNPKPLGFSLRFIGSLYHILIHTPFQHQIFKSNPLKIVPKKQTSTIESPMPGIVISCFVKENQRVSKGDKICVIEAMKMQNVIKSPISGIIDTIGISKGDVIRGGHELIKFK